MFNSYCAHAQQNAKEQPILPVAPSKEERMVDSITDSIVMQDWFLLLQYMES